MVTSKKITEFCKAHNITEAQFKGEEKIGGYLYLESLTSIPEGFNPTVGESLDLRSLTSIPEGFNPTVGGYLYLESLTSIPEGFNPTVGESLNLGSGLAAPTKKYENKLMFWADGKFVKADGIFTEVLNKRGNTYKVKKLDSPKEFYLVSDGNAIHAHGDTLKKAHEDLRFKIASEKIKNEPILEDTIIDINYYRIVTGACEMGVKQWMEANNMTKQSYTAKELLPILKKTNAYGFERFKALISF